MFVIIDAFPFHTVLMCDTKIIDIITGIPLYEVSKNIPVDLT